MSRTERRVAERAEKKAARKRERDGFGGPSIQLQSPSADFFESFIIGNAEHCAELAMEYLPPFEVHALEAQRLPLYQKLAEYTRLQMQYCPTQMVVGQGSREGKSLVICGAGPSLADHAEEYCRGADEVWGCNSALTYLTTRGLPVTHGFAVDQTPEMLTEWASAPDVEYLIASTVHVHLTEYLRMKGRRIRFFHNYVGIKKPPVEWPDEKGVLKRSEYEDWLYALLFPGTVRAGSGLNAVTRAIDVALVMGFETITVLGADCALRVTKPMPEGCLVGSPEHVAWLKESVQMHADGGHALASNATMMTLDGEIDGRKWTSKPDMLISAVFLVQLARKFPQITLVGDTLPNALALKDDAFLDRLPALVDTKGKRIKLY